MKRYLIIFCCLITSLFWWNALAQNGNGDVNGNGNGNGSDSTSHYGSFTPEQVKDIQKIISDYLIKNPEVLVKASQALQQKQEAQTQKDAMAAIKANSQQIFNDAQSPTAGNPDGSVEIVEFFDYQCGHCKAMAPTVEAAVKNNSNIKMIFKELPIFGGSSRFAAKAALAAWKQGKYYEFHNALFAAKSPLDPAIIFKIAKSVGLDVKKLKEVMNEPWVNQQIRDNFQLAQKLKLMGTPAFIISNKDHTKVRFIPGAISQSNFDQQVAGVSAEQ